MLELKESPWKENTEDYVNHRLVLEYIRSFARNNDVEKVVKYNTRVERVEKQGSKWVLSTSTLVKEGTERGRLEYDTEVSDEGNKVESCADMARNLTPLSWLQATITPPKFLTCQA